MPPLSTLPYKKAYRDQWQHTSEHLRAQGCYEWMAEQLDELQPRKILDIGCGCGNGLLALISRFEPQTLVSLDENVGCVDATVKTLKEAGQKPRYHKRLKYIQRAVDLYEVFCTDAPLELGSGISIVQADIGCEDHIVSDALKRDAPFDAITVWLIGTDRQMLQNLGSKPGEYRRQIHERILGLAINILRPGGWLQFVDRCAFPLTADQEQLLVKNHEMLINASHLKVLKHSIRSYEEAGDSGIPMSTLSGQVEHGTEMGLISIIASSLAETSETVSGCKS